MRKDKRYSRRSEAVREAIRNSLSNYELSHMEIYKVVTNIIIINENMRRDVEERLMQLHHEYVELVTRNIHMHLGGTYCREVFFAQGDKEVFFKFIGRIRAIRSVQQVKKCSIHRISRLY